MGVPAFSVQLVLNSPQAQRTVPARVYFLERTSLYFALLTSLAH